ncbi:hypothetical protein A6V39_00275 [Candidatus Mycoplasma haematobovis]|uniref:Uncharacterized protein n=1 Tax=Candidatus Mycoplasma haematobovis TaxID=432608 RepID=A0A1A9QEU8_9MOLU|nr:hypothetical protein [Candidatus Mycoplasma haematobovis]OAL10485.1 hypothetical protein A6V39_00275 [Candidatus Mycoplasma haematobovis]
MTVKTIGLTVAGISTVSGGVAVGSHYLLKPTKSKNIEQLLREDNLNLLNTTDSKTDKDKWEKLIEKFLADSTNQIEKISATINRATDNNNVANITALKNACQELLKKEEGKDTDFEKHKKLAKNWCTKESDLLKEPATPISQLGVSGAISPAGSGVS